MNSACIRTMTATKKKTYMKAYTLQDVRLRLICLNLAYKIECKQVQDMYFNTELPGNIFKQSCAGVGTCNPSWERKPISLVSGTSRASI